MRKSEQQARAQLRAARAEARPIAPDEWSTDETGSRFGFVSAAKIDEVASELMAKHGLDVELVEAVAAAGIYKTRWTWGSEAWRSTPRPIDVPLTFDHGRPAVAAAVSTVRKLFLRQLLELRTAEDKELELAQAMDSGRDVVEKAIEAALRAYCKRAGKPVDVVLRFVTGVDPGRGVELSVRHLPPLQLAELWRWLLWASCGASVVFDPGEAPANTEELPAQMGGAG